MSMLKKLLFYFWLLPYYAVAQQLAPLACDAGEGKIMIAAHRGVFTFSPENSIPALEDAVHLGADIVETDVRLTKDGKVIMFHDATVNRTTNGTGRVCDMTLAELKQLRLKTNEGNTTAHRIPTLEEYLQAADGRVYLYLDKVGIDLPGHEQGHLVREVLGILRENNALDKSVFVLSWPYSTAARIFGDDLKRVVYVPVVEDSIPDLEAYVDEYIQKLSPAAFQFRFRTVDSPAFRLLPHVLASGAQAFVPAWDNTSANHGDRTSIFVHPDEGWGWLIQQGFSIIETNCTRELSGYLKSESHASRQNQ